MKVAQGEDEVFLDQDDVFDEPRDDIAENILSIFSKATKQRKATCICVLYVSNAATKTGCGPTPSSASADHGQRIAADRVAK